MPLIWMWKDVEKSCLCQITFGSLADGGNVVSSREKKE